jgi:hypothetical protein
MQNRLAEPLRAFGILICFAAGAFSQTSYFQLTGVQGATLPIGGVYTSPYYATVGTTTNVAVICDDFADDTYLNESWTAFTTDLSQVGASSVLKWGNGGGAASIGLGLGRDEAYTVAAYLSQQILSAVGGSKNQQDLSYALWGLFDVDAFTYLTNNGLGPDRTAALTAISTAITYVVTHGLNTGNFSAQTGANVTIYSYDTGAMCGAGHCPTEPPQEFIRVSMPEPSYLTMLGVDLLTMVGLIVTFRRRIAGALS